MTSIIKISSLVVVVSFTILLKINLCIAECNLAKIFRTPRDFDHLEIVERAGFEHTEPTTTPPSTDRPACKSTRKNGNNHATAHVSLRFGTDYGSHVMKIPPQVRHLVGNGMSHFPDPIPNPNFIYPPPQPYRTPPPCPSQQFYHPYPPPVPYVFPNYYFWSPREESIYLPPQLNEYFRRHPDFVVARYPYQQEVFVEGRPVRREEVGKVLIPADFVDAKLAPVDLKLRQNNLPMIQSRILRPVDTTKEPVEENDEGTKEIKRDCTCQQKDNDSDVGNTISMEFSDSIEETPYEIYDRNQTNDNTELDDLSSDTDCVQKQVDDTSNPKMSESIMDDVEKEMDELISKLEVSRQDSQDVPNENEDLMSKSVCKEPVSMELTNNMDTLLNKSLVEYQGEDNTSIPKILISYPIFNKDDIVANASSNSRASSSRKPIDEDRKTEDIVNDDTYKTDQGSNSTTNSSTGKHFLKDMDDLVAVMIEIIDTGDRSPSLTLTQKQLIPDYSSGSSPPIANPYVPSDDSLLYPDVISPFSPPISKVEPPPLSSILNLLLGYYDFLNTHPSSINLQTALNQYNSNIPSNEPTELRYPSPSVVSDPKSKVVNNNSDQKIPDTEPKLDYRMCTPPAICLPGETERISKESFLPTYIKVMPIKEETKKATLRTLSALESGVDKGDYSSSYLSSIKRAGVQPTVQTTNYFIPESSILIKEANAIPKYVQIIPRSPGIEDELLPDHIVPGIIPYSNIPDDVPEATIWPDYCRKCGHKHSGGNYCDKCGYPLIFYPSPMNSYCPSCTKEIRQVNDW